MTILVGIYASEVPVKSLNYELISILLQLSHICSSDGSKRSPLGENTRLSTSWFQPLFNPEWSFLWWTSMNPISMLLLNSYSGFHGTVLQMDIPLAEFFSISQDIGHLPCFGKCSIGLLLLSILITKRKTEYKSHWADLFLSSINFCIRWSQFSK